MSKASSGPSSIVPKERVEGSILWIRGQKVLLDSDLAALYRVKTKALVQAIRRNRERFPRDFMFQLEREELSNLRSQFVTSRFWGGRRYLPYAFTEQGVAMLSSVLRSRRAILVNIEIMRAFARFRSILAEHRDLARKVEELEKKFDSRFRVVFEAIRRLMRLPGKRREKIGFRPRSKRGRGRFSIIP